MKILAFGIAKEILGSGSVDITLGREVTVEVLKDRLETLYPELKKLSSFVIAVNNEYAAGNKVVSTTDEVAIIPPVSGG